MTRPEADLKSLLDSVQEMGTQLTALCERVAAIESQLLARPGSSASQRQAESFSEDLLTVITAAVAAYLGERAHLRQIRLLSGNSWMHQGRATIQASHALSKSS